MPLGDIVGGILGQAVWEVIFINILVPVFRFPGAVIGWMIWRGRPFSLVWEKGDGFQQAMVGLVFYVLVALAFVAFRGA